MDGESGRLVLIGDWGSPNFEVLARRLAGRVTILETLDQAPSGSIAIVARGTLGEEDVRELQRLRERPGSPRKVILCVGPETRSRLLERVGPWVDEILPNATASDTVAVRRWAGRERGSFVARGEIQVWVENRQSDEYALLTEALNWLGFRAIGASVRADRPKEALTIWIVDPLKPDWQERMGRKCEDGFLIALLPFADRHSVQAAKDQGAAVCLDWPCDWEDLGWAVDRLSSSSERAECATIPIGRGRVE